MGGLYGHASIRLSRFPWLDVSDVDQPTNTFPERVGGVGSAMSPDSTKVDELTDDPPFESHVTVYEVRDVAVAVADPFSKPVRDVETVTVDEVVGATPVTVTRPEPLMETDPPAVADPTQL